MTFFWFNYSIYISFLLYEIAGIDDTWGLFINNNQSNPLTGVERLNRNSDKSPITSAGFGRFLTLLDRDRERAGEKYEAIRAKLIRFFIIRSFANAEDLADEVINRVIRRIENGEIVNDVIAFCHSAARYVALEERRKPNRETSVSHPSIEQPEDYQGQNETRLDLLDEWLDRLTPENRSLLLEYYKWEVHGGRPDRARLAEQHNMSTAALRSRVHRLRHSLQNNIANILSTEASQRESFYFELRGNSAWGHKVKCGSEVDLVFNYGIAGSQVLAKLRGKQLPRQDANIGIAVSAIGFVFIDHIWYRVAHFRHGALLNCSFAEKQGKLSSLSPPTPLCL